MAVTGSPSWWGERFLGRPADDDLWVLADPAVIYRELREQVGFLAARLAAEGINSGSSVALCMHSAAATVTRACSALSPADQNRRGRRA
jgi:acyl-coenzyme A synthetase/AMP-(fatty) acid ligase